MDLVAILLRQQYVRGTQLNLRKRYTSKVSHRVDYPSTVEELVIDVAHDRPHSWNKQEYRLNRQ